MNLLPRALVPVLLSASALAQTSLWLQAPVADGGVIRPSTVFVNNLGIEFQNDTIAWDEFEFPADTLVTRVRWWGSEPMALGFQLEFFHQEPLSVVSKPDIALSNQPAIVSHTITSFSQVQTYVATAPFYNMYQFEADLPAPMFCAANTRYHLSIYGRQPSTNELWQWASSPTGANGATWWRRSFGIYYNFADNRAFELLTSEASVLGSAFCVATSGCPCGNPGSAGEGCANSNEEGATLVAVGSASVAADDLRLIALQIPANQSCLMIGSTNLTSGSPFGDGRRCVGGPVQRFGVQSSGAAGAVSYGPGLGAYALTHFPAAGHLLAGRTFGFQTWYRDDHGPCNSNSNISSGRQITFVP